MADAASEPWPGLAHVVLTAPGAAPERTTLVVHGILGSAANWRGFVRGLLDGRWGDARQAASWRWVLVDLRGHGDSHGAPPPHTVSACADDLLALEARLGWRFERAIGHSFGGKVVLDLALREARAPDEVWLLDSPPWAASADGVAGDEIARVIGALRALAPDGASLPGRAEVAAHLRAAGMSEALAQWMTTNVRGTASEGYRWKFDLGVVEALVADYFARDLAGRSRPGTRLRAVVGGRSERFGAEERARLVATMPVDVLPDAGHWVHVDDPAGLGRLLTA